MAVAAILFDSPDAPRLRQELLAAHLSYAETVADKILVGGPFREPDGTFIGSLLVLDAPDRDAARAILENDPYFKGGVWSDVRLEPFKPVIGGWVGGKAW